MDSSLNAKNRRRKSIVNLIDEQGFVHFSTLQEKFPNVSDMTLRTDLKELDKQNAIIRIHGGAKSVHAVIGDDYLAKRFAASKDAKEIIAKKALQFIKEGTTIFLDSGTTTTTLATAIPDLPFTIYTSGLTCAMELSHLLKPRVEIIGGTLNRYSLSACGPASMNMLHRIHFSQVFLGVTSFNQNFGFACGIDEEALLKQTVIQQAEQVIFLMDSTKLNKMSTFKFASLADVDIIITDDDCPPEFIELCKAKDVQVI